MLANLVRVVSSTVGTGAITLGAAVSGCLTFAGAGIADGSVVSYGISDGINSEVGRGVYNAGTLSRSLILASTNSGAAINLSGSEQVFITVLAQDVPSMEGWYRFWNTATYVSPTSFSLPGDFTAFFKIGVKVRLENSGIKYGHCFSSSYAGGITTVNLVPNTSLSLANAAISNVDISYGNPPDFPFWFNYLSTLTGETGSAGTFAESVETSRFCAVGRKMTVYVVKTITNLGSWAGRVQVASPMLMRSVHFSGGEVIAAGQLAHKGVLHSTLFEIFTFEKSVGAAYLLWSDMAVGDRIHIAGDFEI